MKDFGQALFNREYFDDDSEVFTCPDCAWQGPRSGLGIEMYDALAELRCPGCGRRLVLVSYPTNEQVREAASAGNAEAQKMLPSEAQVKHRNRWPLLKDPANLPKLRWKRIELTLDFDRFKRVYVVQRGDRVIWREKAYWQDWKRFYVLKRLLARAYGDRFVRPTTTCGPLVADARRSRTGQKSPPRAFPD